MKRYKTHRLWIAGIVLLALLSFFAGTSLACFQKGVGTVHNGRRLLQGTLPTRHGGGYGSPVLPESDESLPGASCIFPSEDCVFRGPYSACCSGSACPTSGPETVLGAPLH